MGVGTSAATGSEPEAAPGAPTLGGGGAPPHPPPAASAPVLPTAVDSGAPAPTTDTGDTVNSVDVLQSTPGEDGAEESDGESPPTLPPATAAPTGDVLDEVMAVGGIPALVHWISKAYYEPCTGVGGAEDRHNELSGALKDLRPALVNGLDDDGFSPLALAAEAMELDVLQVLCSAGADPNVAGEDHGACALHLLAVEGRTPFEQEAVDPAVQVLLGASADINARTTSSGQTPLMLAALYYDIACTEALISHGADVKLTDKSGSTALHLAFKSHKGLPVGELLIAAGADTSVQNNEGVTPAQLREQWNRPRLPDLHEEECQLLGIAEMIEEGRMEPSMLQPLERREGVHAGDTVKLVFLCVAARDDMYPTGSDEPDFLIERMW